MHRFDDRLARLGWDAGRQVELTALDEPGLAPARVATEHRGGYVLFAADGEHVAVPAGRLRRERGGLPAVGDWVAYRRPDGSDRAVVRAVLPRRSAISRKTPLAETAEQVLAANVDVVFVTTAIPDDLNPRRLERYLATVWESGAEPVVVLTKADLADDQDSAVAAVEAVAFGVPVLPVAVTAGVGLDALRAHAAPGRTVALVGSSGVGKSTIVNALLGEDALATGGIRADGRGRHTTTRRELHLLPGGGIAIDTPGLRELQLWDAEAGLAETFDDVERAAAGCRFSDCAHEREPGCAVRAAVASGALPAERLASWRKLGRELEALEARQNALLRSERRRRRKVQARAMRRR